MRTAQESGRLARPIPVSTFPFVTTIEVEDASARPEEPSPCLPTAAALFFELRPVSRGRVVVDLAGSTPVDPLVRLYRRVGSHPATLVFLGCASPVWNAQLALDRRRRGRRHAPRPDRHVRVARRAARRARRAAPVDLSRSGARRSEAARSVRRRLAVSWTLPAMRGREVENPVAAADGRGASSVPVSGARPAAVPEEGRGEPGRRPLGDGFDR